MCSNPGALYFIQKSYFIQNSSCFQTRAVWSILFGNVFTAENLFYFDPKGISFSVYLSISVPGVGEKPGMNLYEIPVTVLPCTRTKRLMLEKLKE